MPLPHMRSTALPTFIVVTALVLGCTPDGAAKASDTKPLNGHLTGPEQSCAECHPRHVDEWRSSSHAYAMHDPVFTAMVALGQKDTAGELGDFCVRCHSPLGFRSGETRVRL